MQKVFVLSILMVFFSCGVSSQENSEKASKTYKITKTVQEWKILLSKQEYYVLREAGTERPFTSPLNKNYTKGVYICKACETPLFKSENKFDSGTGWPSFDKEIEGSVSFSSDNKLGYTRTEELCATCGSHLGHVFNDGPKETTGKRHCINGISLKFIPERNK